MSISDGQDSGSDPPSTSGGGAAVFPPPPTFNVLSNWIFDGIDISKVEDIDQGGSLDMPNMTDASGKPLYTGLYSGPYFDLSRLSNLIHLALINFYHFTSCPFLNEMALRDGPHIDLNRLVNNTCQIKIILKSLYLSSFTMPLPLS